MRKKSTAKRLKSDQTRALILDTALTMFRERGYEQTTMRAIAEKAGVSLGNAYYYFRSKEHLIQAFYQSMHDDHVAVALPALEKAETLKARLLAVVRLKIETMKPYHQFAGVLFKTAADPQSPLNPFAEEANPVRVASIKLFEKVVEGSTARVPKDLKAELPYLLWVFHMGIILFWIHDRSPKHRRTYRLIDHTVELVDKLIYLASNPFMRPLRKQALRLVDELRDAAEDVLDGDDESR
ncbi:MAG TPA: TetR family transcriptional regulator [Pyrinomonadaceae bacterium]|nr:TetR family transcriptional regulator [Pyrinomonadaceae bacterium]